MTPKFNPYRNSKTKEINLYRILHRLFYHWLATVGNTGAVHQNIYLTKFSNHFLYQYIAISTADKSFTLTVLAIISAPHLYVISAAACTFFLLRATIASDAPSSAKEYGPSYVN